MTIFGEIGQWTWVKQQVTYLIFVSIRLFANFESSIIRCIRKEGVRSDSVEFATCQQHSSRRFESSDRFCSFTCNYDLIFTVYTLQAILVTVILHADFVCYNETVVGLFDDFDHQVANVVVEWFGLNTDSVLETGYEFIRQVAVMMNRKDNVA